MLSADPEISNRKVWTGRHYSVPVDPSELVKLFMDQVGNLLLLLANQVEHKFTGAITR